MKEYHLKNSGEDKTQEIIPDRAAKPKKVDQKRVSPSLFEEAKNLLSFKHKSFEFDKERAGLVYFM